MWYPLAFCMLQAATAIVGLPRALRRPKHAQGSWVSPDRGIAVIGRDWPPLIRASRVPAWIRARDFALTLAALNICSCTGCAAFALLLISDWFSYPIFELSTYPAPDWSRIWSALAPFVAIAALLVAWLVVLGRASPGDSRAAAFD